ncbi:MAG TPA: ATP-binding protein [Spirochaetota bacterium]|nr:ATP-binding protein [Spirochaetota bacterium]HOM38773.1 ATP-binding protein [Spirochaetota bacterium]HPQ49571.1 ATP-binding protein [Spirochaetota bacterium]
MVSEKVVVVIDDDPIFNTLVIKLLEQINIKAKGFSEKYGALEYIKGNLNIVSCIIIDVFLPGNQFKEIIEDIRSDVETRYIPIMAITGNKKEDVNKILYFAYQESIDDFLFKPINSHEFTLRIDRLIKLRDSFISLKNQIYDHDKIVNILENKLREVSKIDEIQKQEIKLYQEKIKKEKENYASVIHDIKSALNNISMGISILSNNKNLNSEEKDVINVISSTVNKIVDISKSYLEHLKKENEEIKIEKTNIDILLEILLREYYPKANEKNVMIYLQFQDNINPIYCDKTIILRILSNIIDNAIKYNRPGGSIDIIINQNNEFTRINFIDTGIGIDDNKLNSIFQMFYQADKSVEGYGIGLGWVKRMLDKIGGKINIKSKKDEGTDVEIIIPNKIELVL